ncbi:MAG: DUF1592 domain-containing protein, partial [Gammaproteobacteria bacterium]
ACEDPNQVSLDDGLIDSPSTVPRSGSSSSSEENVSTPNSSGSTSGNSSSTGSVPSSSGTGGADDCGIAYGPRLLRVLTRSEFANSIEDLTGINLITDIGQSTYDAIPVDNMLDYFSNNALTTIDSGALQSYKLVVDNVVDKLSQNNFSAIVDCSNTDASECAALLLNDFAKKVFRRPLTNNEQNAYMELFAADFSGGDVNESLKLAVRSLLTSPVFLYRDETGVLVADSKQRIALKNKSVAADNEYMGGQHVAVTKFEVSAAQALDVSAPLDGVDDDAYVLTQYQLASFLSFTLVGTTPDDNLLQAAANDELKTDDQIAAQVERLLALPRAREHFGDFATQWLRTDRVLEVFKDVDLYPTFTAGVRNAMNQEVRDVFNHVVLDEGEPFTAMYDGDFTFLNNELAQFYGLPSVSGSQMQKVSGIGSRAGLVTSGAFLSVNAHETETAPILRSVNLRRRVLCQEVPAPPTGVSLTGDDIDAEREAAREEWEAMLAANGGVATARDKYSFITSSSRCTGCHQRMINPLGFGFEDFNAVGLPQTLDDNGLTTDASGALMGVADSNDDQIIQFTGAKQLAHEIAGLDTTRRCFVDHMFRLALGTGSTYLDERIGVELSAEEKSNYRCEVNRLDKVMQENNNSTRALLKALGGMDSVRYRKDVQR